MTGMERAMGYVLSLDRARGRVIAAETVEPSRSNVAVARRWRPLEESDRTARRNIRPDSAFFRQWT
ncbi:hypothetical protein V0288_01555 [Pannus brasiliensis CCIBt3594]|uniref:Uncharacterized protein n=1 Tax=Pannus brasiliensis CCIBt3594 TaxID=1427578 RepID=A0AAW9QF96_9CHRO